MTITLALDMHAEADLRYLAETWGKSVDDTAVILIQQRLNEVRKDARIVSAYGPRPHRRATT